MYFHEKSYVAGIVLASLPLVDTAVGRSLLLVGGISSVAGILAVASVAIHDVLVVYAAVLDTAVACVFAAKTSLDSLQLLSSAFAGIPAIADVSGFAYISAVLEVPIVADVTAVADLTAIADNAAFQAFMLFLASCYC